MSSVRSAWFLFPLVALLCLAVQASAQTLPKAPVVDPADEPENIEGIPEPQEVEKQLEEETQKLEDRGFPSPDRGSKETRQLAVVGSALWHSLSPEQQRQVQQKQGLAADKLPEDVRKAVRLIAYHYLYQGRRGDRGRYPAELAHAFRDGRFNLIYTEPPGPQGVRIRLRAKPLPGRVWLIGVASSDPVPPPRAR